MSRRYGGWLASYTPSGVFSAVKSYLSRRPFFVLLATVLPLLGSWAVPTIISSGCRADQTVGTKDGSHQAAYLAVMQRQISPALVIVHLVNADGSHVLIEYVPPDREIARVLEGRVNDVTTLFEQLETDGFFEWPDSSLVPPPDRDVDSDPLVVVLDTGTKNRRVFTREPHIHPAVQTLLDTLASSVGKMTKSDSCLVCIPQLMRVPDPDLYEIKDTSEPWARKLVRLSIGPFPIVVPPGEAESTPLAQHKEFCIQAAQGTYRVKCILWP
jgi:hypothetical protein